MLAHITVSGYIILTNHVAWRYSHLPFVSPNVQAKSEQIAYCKLLQPWIIKMHLRLFRRLHQASTHLQIIQVGWVIRSSPLHEMCIWKSNSPATSRYRKALCTTVL